MLNFEAFCCHNFYNGTAVVAQLVEWLLQIPKDESSNLVIAILIKSTTEETTKIDKDAENGTLKIFFKRLLSMP